MDNETTMPGLLTLPSELVKSKQAGKPVSGFYKLIFAAAVLVLTAVIFHGPA